MRKIIVSEFLSVDGVMEDPGGSEKTVHGGWSLKFSNDESFAYKQRELFSCDALLLGRVTYEGFAAAWPDMEGTGEFGERMNGIPKYVVSTTLREATWQNTQIIKSNIFDEIQNLKDQPGQDILMFGSARLVQSLMEHKLIDEYRLMLHSTVLGQGKKLFADGTPRTDLQLVDCQRFGQEIVVLTYRQP